MKKQILNESTALLKLERMAYEIVEQNLGEKELLLAGIRGCGTTVAQVMREQLERIAPFKISSITIELDKKHPAEVVLSEPTQLDGKVVIVADDVSSSGKTMMYALKPFLSAHPKKIQTLVLVERTHKAFPVNFDFVGLSVATTLQEQIVVEVEGGKVKGAYLE